MSDKQEAIKAFREARVAGEKKLFSGEITWDEYAAVMRDHELFLRETGVEL